ncbi:hypothetical protein ACGC1H_007219 [Rhizoctonia solani]
MLGWIKSSSPGSVYWMSGMAGTGKTTIAYSLCEELNANRQLGASFFCSRLLPECRDVNLIIPSIAYQLAHSSYPFQFVLAGVLEKDPDVHTRLPQLQFDTLLAQPLFEVKDTLADNLVVVIDALDECDNKESTSRILDMILMKALDLPIKFIVSSRPEPEIRDEMVKQRNQPDSRVVLHELDRDSVQVDIETYLRATLAQMKPTEEQISKLVEHSGILFIYAATAVRYVSYDKFSRNPHTRLANILESSSQSENKHKDIDELYTTVLRAALDDPNLDSEEKNDMRLVLKTVICAQEPLTVDILSRLLRTNDTDRVNVALRPLWSLLHISGASELVTTLHASFPDYMLDLGRSKQYHCDQRIHNQTIAHLCFECFGDVRPQFNICGLRSSYVPDSEVEGLEERVKNAISAELFYVSRYWAAHLQYTPGPPDLIRQLEEFLSTRLLLWMEVMNLKKCTGSMPEILWLIKKWGAVSRVESLTGLSTDRSIQKRSIEPELDALIHDAWRFISTFAFGAVSDSTPHIYTSMLPFWPEFGPVAKHYTRSVQGLINPEGTALSRQEHALLATWSFDGYTSSPVFSPDGSRIAVGVGNRICLLDSSTGRTILPPFEVPQGHWNSFAVAMIQFSPDGSLILASDHTTVYAWSTHSGKIVLGPFKGAHREISQVAFSPDGASVISLSSRRVIRIWDAFGGERTIDRPDYDGIHITTASISCSSGKQCIVFGYSQGILVYDSQGVWTRRTLSTDNSDRFLGLSQVKISPNSARVAAVQNDSIYIWDLETGKLVLGPLNNKSQVWSISFSPDGFYLISTSSNAICVWDLRNGNLILGPLKEYASLRSPCFSPDSAYIICATGDRRLCLWDFRSSTRVTLDPLQGHTSSVFSVNFSPDGGRLISRSSDRATATACVWNAESGEMVLGPLELSPRAPLAAFSPEGSRIIMQGKYGLVFLDSQTGNITVGPFNAIHNPSVAFSPDGARIAISQSAPPQVFYTSGNRAHYVWIVSVDTGKTLCSICLQHEGYLASPSFTPDGACIRIYSRGQSSPPEDDRIYVYDAHSGKLLNDKVHETPLGKLSPDGTQIISCFRSRVIVYDIKTGQKVFRSLEGHTNEYGPYGFSSDCTHIVYADIGRANIWNIGTGQRVLGPLTWHTSTICSITFSPDDTRVVSGSQDQTIRVTDIQKNPALTPGSSPDDFGEWVLRKDGWVVDDSSKLLVWIPPNLRTSLMFPRTKLLISRRGQLRLNFEGAYIGESWAKCYRSV